MKTLNLAEAAAFLHMHPEELRSRAKRGVINGSHCGAAREQANNASKENESNR